MWAPDTGSRLAAGALNNPVVYNRIGSGLSISQMITDFGRTGNLVARRDLRAKRRTGDGDHPRQILLAPTGRTSPCCARRPC